MGWKTSGKILLKLKRYFREYSCLVVSFLVVALLQIVINYHLCFRTIESGAETECIRDGGSSRLNLGTHH